MDNVNNTIKLKAEAAMIRMEPSMILIPVPQSYPVPRRIRNVFERTCVYLPRVFGERSRRTKSRESSGDVAWLAYRWNKPLGARLVPASGKRIGDQTDISGGILVQTT